MFEEVVETNKKMVAEGKGLAAHAILVRDNRPEVLIGLSFIDNFSKHIAFNLALPQIIRMYIPETCIFVLPSKLKELDPEGNIIREDDVVMVYEVDAIKIRAVIIKRKDGGVEVIEPDERKTQAPLMEPIREVMMSVWEGII